MAKALLTVRLDESQIEALDRVAGGIDRDRTYVVTQAITAYLDTQAWQVKYIEEAVHAAEEGGVRMAGGEFDAHKYDEERAARYARRDGFY